MSNLIDVTHFSDCTGKIKFPGKWSMAELTDRLVAATAARKEDLQLIKLAVFGNVKSPNGSYRHDKNLISATGCEGEQDIGAKSFDEAVDRLKHGIAGRIECLIYTTPSHTPEHPRWRVLVPFSRPLDPSLREKMVARLNGILGGVLSPESFTLSQSFYFGRIEGDMNFRFEHIRDQNGSGCSLLDRVNIDDKAIGKPGNGKTGKTDNGNNGNPGDAELVRRFFTGEALHPSILVLVGRWAASNISKDAVLGFFKAIFDGCGQDRYEGRWEEIDRTVGDIYQKEENKEHALTYDEVYAYAEQHNYIVVPFGATWPKATIDARLPKRDGMKPSAWLDSHQTVDQRSWVPGEPKIIRGKHLAEGDWVYRPASVVFNHYNPPQPGPGIAAMAEPWLDHLKLIYPHEWEHLLAWFAFRVQKPNIKINHALVLGGSQGIGKDTLLEPVRHAVGHWNCQTVSPIQLTNRFNSFLRSVLLVVSEARDLGEVNRPNFYEHTKGMITSPPKMILIDEKHVNPYLIPNLTGMIITTNHKTAGIYLPRDDRRHFVAWSESIQDHFHPNYWIGLWEFYLGGGMDHVATYLQEHNVSRFNPGLAPPKTAAFYEICLAGGYAETSEIEDAIALLANRDALTVEDIAAVAKDDFPTWIRDRKNRKLLPRWMESAGYVTLNNESTSDGRWTIGGRKNTVYVRSDLTPEERFAAVQRLVRIGN
jgi:hypothetical protein